MAFCIKCGSNLKKGSKFCTSCGEKIDFGGFKPKDKPAAETKTAKASFQSESSQHDQPQDIVSNNSLKNKLLGFYIILVIPLYILGQGTEEMIGFSIYSAINIVVISLRINKTNTFNAIVKILLLLQFVFILSMIIPQADYLFINLYSSIATLLFAALSLVIFLMVLIGNRK